MKPNGTTTGGDEILKLAIRMISTQPPRLHIVGGPLTEAAQAHRHDQFASGEASQPFHLSRVPCELQARSGQRRPSNSPGAPMLGLPDTVGRN